MRSTARGAVGRQSQAQQRLRCHRSVNLPGVVAAIGPNQVEPRDAAASLIENQTGPVAVLNRGKVDNDPHRQPLAVDQGVDLAALYLLAGVVTHLVVLPPFLADLIDWLSRTPAEGLASRPIRSCNAICSSAQTASQTPSRWNLRNERQIAPRAAGPQQVQNGVNRRPHVGLARSPAGAGPAGSAAPAAPTYTSRRWPARFAITMSSVAESPGHSAATPQNLGSSSSHLRGLRRGGERCQRRGQT